MSSSSSASEDEQSTMKNESSVVTRTVKTVTKKSGVELSSGSDSEGEGAVTVTTHTTRTVVVKGGEYENGENGAEIVTKTISSNSFEEAGDTKAFKSVSFDSDTEKKIEGSGLGSEKVVKLLEGSEAGVTGDGGVVRKRKVVKKKKVISKKGDEATSEEWVDANKDAQDLIARLIQSGDGQFSTETTAVRRIINSDGTVEETVEKHDATSLLAALGDASNFEVDVKGVNMKGLECEDGGTVTKTIFTSRRVKNTRGSSSSQSDSETEEKSKIIKVKSKSLNSDEEDDNEKVSQSESKLITGQRVMQSGEGQVTTETTVIRRIINSDGTVEEKVEKLSDTSSLLTALGDVGNSEIDINGINLEGVECADGRTVTKTVITSRIVKTKGGSSSSESDSETEATSKAIKIKSKSLDSDAEDNQKVSQSESKSTVSQTITQSTRVTSENSTNEALEKSNIKLDHKVKVSASSSEESSDEELAENKKSIISGSVISTSKLEEIEIKEKVAATEISSSQVELSSKAEDEASQKEDKVESTSEVQSSSKAEVEQILTDEKIELNKAEKKIELKDSSSESSDASDEETEKAKTIVKSSVVETSEEVKTKGKDQEKSKHASSSESSEAESSDDEKEQKEQKIEKVTESISEEKTAIVASEEKKKKITTSSSEDSDSEEETKKDAAKNLSVESNSTLAKSSFTIEAGHVENIQFTQMSVTESKTESKAIGFIVTSNQPTDIELKAASTITSTANGESEEQSVTKTKLQKRASSASNETSEESDAETEKLAEKLGTETKEVVEKASEHQNITETTVTTDIIEKSEDVKVSRRSSASSSSASEASDTEEKGKKGDEKVKMTKIVRVNTAPSSSSEAESEDESNEKKEVQLKEQKSEALESFTVEKKFEEQIIEVSKVTESSALELNKDTEKKDESTLEIADKAICKTSTEFTTESTAVETITLTASKDASVEENVSKTIITSTAEVTESEINLEGEEVIKSTQSQEGAPTVTKKKKIIKKVKKISEPATSLTETQENVAETKSITETLELSAVAPTEVFESSKTVTETNEIELEETKILQSESKETTKSKKVSDFDSSSRSSSEEPDAVLTKIQEPKNVEAPDAIEEELAKSLVDDAVTTPIDKPDEVKTEETVATSKVEEIIEKAIEQIPSAEVTEIVEKISETKESVEKIDSAISATSISTEEIRSDKVTTEKFSSKEESAEIQQTSSETLSASEKVQEESQIDSTKVFQDMPEQEPVSEESSTGAVKIKKKIIKKKPKAVKPEETAQSQLSSTIIQTSSASAVTVAEFNKEEELLVKKVDVLASAVESKVSPVTEVAVTSPAEKIKEVSDNKTISTDNKTKKESTVLKPDKDTEPTKLAEKIETENIAPEEKTEKEDAKVDLKVNDVAPAVTKEPETEVAKEVPQEIGTKEEEKPLEKQILSKEKASNVEAWLASNINETVEISEDVKKKLQPTFSSDSGEDDDAIWNKPKAEEASDITTLKDKADDAAKAEYVEEETLAKAVITGKTGSPYSMDVPDVDAMMENIMKKYNDAVGSVTKSSAEPEKELPKGETEEDESVYKVKVITVEDTPKDRLDENIEAANVDKTIEEVKTKSLESKVAIDTIADSIEDEKLTKEQVNKYLESLGIKRDKPEINLTEKPEDKVKTKSETEDITNLIGYEIKPKYEDKPPRITVKKEVEEDLDDDAQELRKKINDYLSNDISSKLAKVKAGLEIVEANYDEEEDRIEAMSSYQRLGESRSEQMANIRKSENEMMGKVVDTQVGVVRKLGTLSAGIGEFNDDLTKMMKELDYHRNRTSLGISGSESYDGLEESTRGSDTYRRRTGSRYSERREFEKGDDKPLYDFSGLTKRERPFISSSIDLDNLGEYGIKRASTYSDIPKKTFQDTEPTYNYKKFQTESEPEFKSKKYYTDKTKDLDEKLERISSMFRSSSYLDTKKRSTDDITERPPPYRSPTRKSYESRRGVESASPSRARQNTWSYEYEGRATIDDKEGVKSYPEVVRTPYVSSATTKILDAEPTRFRRGRSVSVVGARRRSVSQTDTPRALLVVNPGSSSYTVRQRTATRPAYDSDDEVSDWKRPTRKVQTSNYERKISRAISPLKDVNIHFEDYSREPTSDYWERTRNDERGYCYMCNEFESEGHRHRPSKAFEAEYATPASTVASSRSRAYRAKTAEPGEIRQTSYDSTTRYTTPTNGIYSFDLRRSSPYRPISASTRIHGTSDYNHSTQSSVYTPRPKSTVTSSAWDSDLEWPEYKPRPKSTIPAEWDLGEGSIDYEVSKKPSRYHRSGTVEPKSYDKTYETKSWKSSHVEPTVSRSYGTNSWDSSKFEPRSSARESRSYVTKSWETETGSYGSDGRAYETKSCEDKSRGREGRSRWQDNSTTSNVTSNITSSTTSSTMGNTYTTPNNSRFLQKVQRRSMTYGESAKPSGSFKSRFLRK